MVINALNSGSNVFMADNVTADLCHSLSDEEMLKIRDLVGEAQFTSGHYVKARELIEGMVSSDHFTEFMTLAGYEHLD